MGLTIKLLALGCVLTLAACTEEPPEITRPNNRIQYFLAKEFYKMTSQEKYQEFIESELGGNFSENDFVRYMEKNEAECERDKNNNITYCVYVDFKLVRITFDPSKNLKSVNYFCFWALPPSERPRVRFRQAGAGGVVEFPASRAGFARAPNFPGCRIRLLQEHGTEK